MPMQYDWDWTQDYSAKEEIESDFLGAGGGDGICDCTLEPIKFDGPGLYLTENDTVLIIPMHEKVEPVTIWDRDQPEGTIWRVFVWNCPFNRTFLSVPVPPVRQWPAL